MRIVIDTNVFLSALITPRGVPDVIYRAWISKKFELVTSIIQLDELRRASRYPKFKEVLQPARVGTMINNLQHAVVLEHLDIDVELNDPNDAFLVSMSLLGNADYLITGDHRSGLLQKATVNRTRILTPAIFCSNVLQL